MSLREADEQARDDAHLQQAIAASLAHELETREAAAMEEEQRKLDEEVEEKRRFEEEEKKKKKKEATLHLVLRLRGGTLKRTRSPLDVRDQNAAMATTPPASADSGASHASSSGLFDRAWKRVEDLALNVTKKDGRRELKRAQREGEDEETVLQQALALLVEQHSKAASRKSSVRTRREERPKCPEFGGGKSDESCCVRRGPSHVSYVPRGGGGARAATTTRTWRTSASIARSGSSSRARRRASMGGPGGPSCRATQALLRRWAQQWMATAMR